MARSSSCICGAMVKEIHDAMGITVPVALHLDHGSYEGAKAAIEAGFTPVMFDGSHYAFEENLEKSKENGQAARAQRCVSLVAAGRQARRGGLLLPYRRQDRSRRPSPAHSRIPFPARERARTALRQAQQRTRRSRRLSRPQALSIGEGKLLRSSNRTKRTGYPVRFPFSREISATRGLLSLIFAHSPAILHSSSDKEALL